jgi:hypothetical protein
MASASYFATNMAHSIRHPFIDAADFDLSETYPFTIAPPNVDHPASHRKASRSSVSVATQAVWTQLRSI